MALATGDMKGAASGSKDIAMETMKSGSSIDMEHTPMSNAERQFALPEYSGTYEDINDMVIQFGYVTLFAVAFPLAPLCALANNIIELRMDARKILMGTRKPYPHAASSIGIWYHILQLIGICAVISVSGYNSVDYSRTFSS